VGALICERSTIGYGSLKAYTYNMPKKVKKSPIFSVVSTSEKLLIGKIISFIHKNQ
jgi:hypothetical protein